MSTIDETLAQLNSPPSEPPVVERASNVAVLAQERARQFRLCRIQLKDWGTYHGLLTLDVPERGQLFVGHSGSGKSTIFDAHSVLLTPPKYLRLNQASREDGKRSQDRSIINYVRGVWGTAQGADGRGVAKLLRVGTTWSGIVEVYRNGDGREVSVAHVYWVRGASADLHHRYLFAERSFDLRELDFFVQADFDTSRLHKTLRAAGVEPFDRFVQYAAAFSRVLGIRDEMALRLLHKTQSTKSVDSITDFLRDFMLDEPSTFEIAKDLVTSFQKLKQAHDDWETASAQRDVLMPARNAYQRLEGLINERICLDEIDAGIKLYTSILAMEVHEKALTRGAAPLEAKRALLKTLDDARIAAENRHLNAVREEQQGGGGDLRDMESDLDKARTALADAKSRRSALAGACEVLGQPTPSTRESFADLQAEASLAVAAGIRQDSTKFQKAAGDKAKFELDRNNIDSELATLARAPNSNVPTEQQSIRTRVAEALEVDEDVLPFAAELISVKVNEERWHGALERLMSGFGLTMLVPTDLFDDVRGYIDRNHLRGRIGYRPVRPVTESAKAKLPANACSKVDVTDHECARWLSNELHGQFDFACVENANELGNYPRALSINGQIRRPGENYVKDDRWKITDRSRWVLGTDTRARAAALQDLRDELLTKIAEAQSVIDEYEREQDRRTSHWQAYNVVNGLSWYDMDETGALTKIRDIEDRIQKIKENSPFLEALQREVKLAADAKQDAIAAWAEQHTAVQNAEAKRTGYVLELNRLRSLPPVSLTPTQREAVDEMRNRRTSESTPENYDREIAEMERTSAGDLAANTAAQAAAKAEIVRALSIFCANSEWKVATKGHDPVLDSYDFFDAFLTTLLSESVSETWERFLRELQEHNSQQLTLLAQSLSSEYTDMLTRLNDVNESLENTAYNEGTHLKIHRVDRKPQSAVDFSHDIAVVMSEVANVETVEQAKERFGRLHKIAERLASDRSEDIRWRREVLDVRQHVLFDAHEIEDHSNVVRDVYNGSDGKSGGQKQKLAATCMAAALRYQLADVGGTLPQFSTVVIDEAFDRSDPDFAEAALNVFRELGFQIIVATPGKMVQTIEPYVGGAVWVYARRGDRSNAVALRYDDVAGRIDYTPMHTLQAPTEDALPS